MLLFPIRMVTSGAHHEGMGLLPQACPLSYVVPLFSGCDYVKHAERHILLLLLPHSPPLPLPLSPSHHPHASASPSLLFPAACLLTSSSSSLLCVRCPATRRLRAETGSSRPSWRHASAHRHSHSHCQHEGPRTPTVSMRTCRDRHSHSHCRDEGTHTTTVGTRACRDRHRENADAECCMMLQVVNEGGRCLRVEERESPLSAPRCLTFALTLAFAHAYKRWRAWHTCSLLFSWTAGQMDSWLSDGLKSILTPALCSSGCSGVKGEELQSLCWSLSDLLPGSALLGKPCEWHISNCCTVHPSLHEQAAASDTCLLCGFVKVLPQGRIPVPPCSGGNKDRAAGRCGSELYLFRIIIVRNYANTTRSHHLMLNGCYGVPTNETFCNDTLQANPLNIEFIN